MNVGKTTFLFSILLLLPLLWACGESRNPDAVAAWQVDTAAVLEIGKAEEDPLYQLYRIRSIAELPDGGIAIANQGSSEIRLYDARGRFVRALGRDGSGPGEFGGLLNMVARGDTLYAYDIMYHRLTRFLSSGVYLDDRVLRPHATRMVPVFAGLLGDGTPVAWTPELPGEAVEGFQRESAMVVRFRADGTLDTLGHFAGRESIIHRRDLGGGTIAMAGYLWGFYRTFLAAAGGHRIYAGATDSAVIHVWDGAGAPLPSLRWGDVPRPLDDDAVNALFERETSNLEPAERETERKEMRGAPRPPTAPVFDRLVLAPDGKLWVRRFDQPGADMSEWLVFDSEGALRARASIPREREIRAIGRKLVYTLERDEYDVEYVRGYPLLRTRN